MPYGEGTTSLFGLKLGFSTEHPVNKTTIIIGINFFMVYLLSKITIRGTSQGERAFTVQQNRLQQSRLYLLSV